MKVALIHDWLECYSGAEKVLEELIQLYPEADLYSLVDFLPEKDRRFLWGKKPFTSFIQNLPFAKKHFRKYLLLMPLAIEQFDLSSYDLVISSSHAFAKGVITGPNQVHISYVYTPMRYAWDLTHQYLDQTNLKKGIKSWLVRIALHYLRMWDFRTAHGVDCFIACSQHIARRIRKTYGKAAEVIYPPVLVEDITASIKGDFYVTAQRMVPYKRVDLIVGAFAKMPDKKLIVIGDGPEYDKVRSLAGSNTVFLGRVDQKTLGEHLMRAKAFVFAAEEDFGITVVEAQACGTPVIAYGKGGALETVIHGKTGLFFYEQNEMVLMDVIAHFEAIEHSFDVNQIKENALRYSRSIFLAQFKDCIKLNGF